MLDISCYLLNTVLKVRNRIVYPRAWVADWERRLAGRCPASQESIILFITCPGKDQNSKFERRLPLNAYHFHTIVKLKNKSNHRKSNHRKLEIICIQFHKVLITSFLYFYIFTLGQKLVLVSWLGHISSSIIKVKSYLTHLPSKKISLICH